MLIDLRLLQKKYNLNINGVIHIGAHYGEEDKIYDELKIKKRIYFEPLKTNYDILIQKTNSEFCKYHNVALGNSEGEIYMNLSSNNNASASVLEPKNHLELHRNVKFNGTEKVKIKKLDSFNISNEYNMINIDVQGYELEVFKGGSKTLDKVDYIMSEVNRDEVYKDCPHIDDLIKFLSPYGFTLVEENWAGRQWGDAFFIKKL